MRRSALLLLSLGLAGCVSISEGNPKPMERDGQAFGVVDGTFRGRWWNHYERGRSYLDGGFYSEAAADLKTAIALRAEDQRWARTYGLHFIPEYFPNRELGITRFHEGQLEEAQQLLERSLAQEHTALAAHYLDLVRAAQVSQGGGDVVPPVITAGRVEAQVGEDGMQSIVYAEVSDNTYVASITINGEPYLLAQSAPQVEVAAPFALDAGANAFHVVATDIAGNVSESTIALERDFDGPTLSFDSPANAGLVSGVAYDPSGIASLHLGDKSVELTPADDGTLRFSMLLTCGGSFSAVDRLGNVNTGQIPGTVAQQHAGALQRGVLRLAANVDDAWIAAALSNTQLAQNNAPDIAGIRLSNLADGQRFLMDEIVVAIDANDPDGIAAIEVDGVPLKGLVPGATSQFLSRRIRLTEMGPHTIHAKLSDGAGNVSETSVSIERAPTAIELPGELLRVALLGNLWEGAGPTLENEATFVAEELTGALFRRGRMDLVSRDALPRVLEEQELRTVLGSRDLDPALRQIVPADLLAVGKVRRTGDTMEIILQAVSSETSNILAYADVAGTVRSLDDLRALTRDLALRFEQEFPRVGGEVVNVPGQDRCFTTLSTADRVRPELPCVVYRLGEPIVHPATGTVLGRPTDIIARGTLVEVQRQVSRLSLLPHDPALGPVQVNDHVATR